jgi:hypothetical protein
MYVYLHSCKYTVIVPAGFYIFNEPMKEMAEKSKAREAAEKAQGTEKK